MPAWSQASAFSMEIINYKEMLVIKNPAGNGHGFCTAPQYPKDNLGTDVNANELSANILGRMLRTNES